MDLLVIIAAFFFAIMMCLGLILVKWCIMQLGSTLFFLIVFLAGSIFILSVGSGEHDDE